MIKKIKYVTIRRVTHPAIVLGKNHQDNHTDKPKLSLPTTISQSHSSPPYNQDISRVGTKGVSQVTY